MSKKLEDDVTKKLMALHPSMPEEKARIKSRSTVRGLYLMVVGGASLLVGLGIVIVPMITLKQAPSVWLIALGALAIIVGFQLGLMGANAYSGEVTDAKATDQGNSMILTIGRAIGLARGKIKNGDGDE